MAALLRFSQLNPSKLSFLPVVRLNSIPISGYASSATADCDEPISLRQDPYRKPNRKCSLCQADVNLNYKNVQLLSQFVSPHTGNVYGRHITGLCIPMQKRVSQLIRKSQFFGFMPIMRKETYFMNDQQLFTPPKS